MIFNMPSKQLQISKTLPAMRDSFFFYFAVPGPVPASEVLFPRSLSEGPLHPASHTPGPVRLTDLSQEIRVGGVLVRVGWGGVGWRLRTAIESFRWWSLMPVIIQHTQGTPADDDVSDVPGQD